nr:heparinase II/III family protein [Clostridia bacterium]
MKIYRKIMAGLLSLSLSLGLFLTVLLSAGITVHAASATYRSELWILSGEEEALLRGSRVALSEPAYTHPTGALYIPLDAVCQYASASYTTEGDTVSISTGAVLTVGSTTWSGGELFIPPERAGDTVMIPHTALGDILGLRFEYNGDIGLVIIYHSYTTSKTLKVQIETLGELLFDRPTQEKVISDFNSHSGSGVHPRLLADGATFDALRERYVEDSAFGKKLRSFAYSCAATFDSYFKLDALTGEVIWKSEEARLSTRQPYYVYDENGNRLVGQTSYTYYDTERGEQVTVEAGGSGRGDGYDVGGRAYPEKIANKLRELAFAWQILGDDTYADAFYMLATELGKWEHWGEGHFLNTADASVAYAIGLDWIWHAFDSEPEKRDELSAILYDKGLMMGYYSIVCDSLYSGGSEPKLTGKQSTYLNISYTAGTGGWRTINRETNWQTVCGSGMMVAALLLMDYEQYRQRSAFVIEQYLLSNERCISLYAPDGSYIESPSYWEYGTNALMVSIGALNSALGTSYGLDRIVGLDDSFYYTVGIANGRLEMWNYHDAVEGKIDYSSFYLASTVYNDPTLAALRDEMIFEKGMQISLMDILYYDEGLSEGAEPESIPLDFNFKGIDTATFRSSYDADAVFTGLHAGPTHVTHGDFDCGNFTLSMGGVNWITDPGTEDYNVKGFFDATESGRRYKYYAKSTEGHSTVMITSNSSIPLGQKYITNTGDYARIEKFHSDENGGYAITDMTTEYGSTCTSGKRGVLLTNSRSTVVLQDEIEFSSPTSLVWMLNLNNFVRIAEDGRSLTAHTFVDSEKLMIRVTLISPDESLRFRLMDDKYTSKDGKYETVFDSTYTATNNNYPLAKDPVQRVVIEANGVTSFNTAVVFQLLGHEDEIVPYKRVDMSDWSTSDDEWVREANKDIVYPDEVVKPKYNSMHFKKALDRLEAAESMTEIGAILRETCHILSDYDNGNATCAELARQYREYRRAYNLLLRAMNESFDDLLFDR